MRKAILVAMHDSKNVVYVEDKDNKLLAYQLAPKHRPLLKGVTGIECYWWDDSNTIELHITGAGGEETILLYQGSYTAILVPEPSAKEVATKLLKTFGAWEAEREL